MRQRTNEEPTNVHETMNAAERELARVLDGAKEPVDADNLIYKERKTMVVKSTNAMVMCTTFHYNGKM
jgi:hypothetical protein